MLLAETFGHEFCESAFTARSSRLCWITIDARRRILEDELRAPLALALDSDILRSRRQRVRHATLQEQHFDLLTSCSPAGHPELRRLYTRPAVIRVTGLRETSHHPHADHSKKPSLREEFRKIRSARTGFRRARGCAMMRNSNLGRTMSEGLPERAAIGAGSLLEQFFEGLPDAIVITDNAGSIVRVNAELERSFGYGRSELVGQPVELLIPERFRPSHPAHRQTYGNQPRRRPMGAGLDLLARRKDGSEFPVDIMLSPVDTPGGSLVLCAIRDISERRLAEAALEQSEQRFRLFVETVRDYAIFQLDPEGRIRTWNSAAEHMKGYKTDEIVGRHFSCFYPPEDVATGKPERELKVASETGRCEDEGWRLRKDGSRFWANVTIGSIRDRTGKLMGFAKITRDATERKNEEEALRTANSTRACSLNYRPMPSWSAIARATSAKRTRASRLCSDTSAKNC